ncbi:MAG: glycosyltransferase family 4 protein [Sulfitobacter sp.]
MTDAVFAIPGDKDRRTGGFIYEATVLRVLNEVGCTTQHLALPDSFPDPTPDDVALTLELLRAVPASTPIILDGLVFGSINTEGLTTVDAPVIAMVHHPLGLETGLSTARSDFLKANEAAALKHVTHVIVPSPHTAEILICDFGADPAKITIAAPGFARPAVAPAPIDPPLIFSVGLLAERKGHDVLIAALALIQDIPWQAEIAGKAHDLTTATTLKEQIEALGLSGRVKLSGELSEDDLNARFNAASVFALATRYEGYGMVLSEAMQYGLPVVTCAVGAVPETVGNAGVLVPVDDPVAFASALRRLLTQPEECARLTGLSRQNAARLPTWEDTAQIFASVVSRLSLRSAT